MKDCDKGLLAVAVFIGIFYMSKKETFLKSSYRGPDRGPYKGARPVPSTEGYR